MHKVQMYCIFYACLHVVHSYSISYMEHYKTTRPSLYNRYCNFFVLKPKQQFSLNYTFLFPDHKKHLAAFMSVKVKQ